MDIVRFKGGLGNQMFQYALVEALRSKGREVCCNLGFYRNHPESMPFVLDQVFLNLELNEISDNIFEKIDKKWRKIKSDEKALKNFELDYRNRFFYVEKEDCKYDKNIFKTKDCTFVGYWQTEKYFKTIRKKIIKLYTFENIELKLEKLGRQIENQYVSVHIRRGDYLNTSLFHTFTIDYYIKAIRYIERIMPGVNFIFFSDDTNWVKNNFELKNMIVCEANLFENYKDWYDMYLMTLCRGNIIANSSFSWWGAWLNKNKNAVIIAPHKWFAGCNTPDIWCENWICM